MTDETNSQDSKARKKPSKKRLRGVRQRVRRMTAWDDVSDTFADTRTLYDTALGKTDTGRRLHKESFREACQRLGLTESDLEERRQRAALMFWIVFAASLALVVYAAWLLATASGFVTVLSGLATLALAGVLGVTAFRSAFRNWQIRHRRLGGLRTFLREPGEWPPR